MEQAPPVAVNDVDAAVELLDPIIITSAHQQMAHTSSAPILNQYISPFSVNPSFVSSHNPLHNQHTTQLPPTHGHFLPPLSSVESHQMLPSNMSWNNSWMNLAPITPFNGMGFPPGCNVKTESPMEFLNGIMPLPYPFHLMASLKNAADNFADIRNLYNQQNSCDSGVDSNETQTTTMGTNSVGNFTDAQSVVPSVSPTALLPSHPINSYETYCTVPGRFTLLSSQRKYRVTIGEIQRRISPPERLNASILGGILRKAKNKNKGRMFRERLRTFGVELPAGRRKQGAVTCFTSLVEAEAAQMAFDFQMLCQQGYPVQAVAANLFPYLNNDQDISLSRLELFYASKFISRILSLQRADKSTTLEQQHKMEPDNEHSVGLNPELQEGLSKFNLITHGFGGPAVQTVLETMLRLTNECSDALEQNFRPNVGQ